MLIRIEYRSGYFDMVDQDLLTRLLAADRVLKFWRSTGWVYVRRDALRRMGRNSHVVQENQLKSN